MIIKNLTRKSGTGQLFRYIFRYVLQEEKTQPKDAIELERQKYEAAGFKLTRLDAQHLLNEKADYYLYKDFKEKCPDGNYTEYIQNCLMNREYQIPGWEQAGKPSAEPFILRYNVQSTDIHGLIKEFQDNEAKRIHKRVDQVSVHHTVLSWHGLDREHVNEAMVKDILGEYIRLRGTNNKYVAALHRDKDHMHCHIVMSGTQLNGLSSRISQKDFQQVKVQLQEYQRTHYQNLTHSLPEHGKAERQRQRGEYEKIKRNERHSILNTLLSCIETIEPQSTAHFFGELEKHGFSTYTRGDKVAGVESSGYKFRFSRLSVDLEKLEVLDKENARIEGELDSLAAIRSGGLRERINTSLVTEKEADQERELDRDEDNTSRISSSKNDELADDREETDTSDNEDSSDDTGNENN